MCLGVLTGCAVLVPLVLEDHAQPEAGQASAPAASAAPATGRSARAEARSRCETCGVVESITRFEPHGAQAASYEFTVRLRDGSARVSSLPSPSAWRVGDAIMLMGGVAALTVTK